MTREEQLQQALEMLLPIACFGIDYLEQQGKEDHYLVAMSRVRDAQSILGINNLEVSV